MLRRPFQAEGTFTVLTLKPENARVDIPEVFRLVLRLMNLLLLDDHPLVRQGLATLLAQAGATVRTASAPAEALAMLDAGAAFDVVLLDWNLPGSDGAATVAALAARGLTVLVVSGSAEADDVRRALAAGALGFVPKSAALDTLLAAIRQVQGGLPYLPAGLLREIASLAPVPAASDLTARQHDVLRLMAMGLPNKRIGQQLDLSDKTVKAHVTAIFKALGVVNRSQAIARAHALGWLEHAEPSGR